MKPISGEQTWVFFARKRIAYFSKKRNKYWLTIYPIPPTVRRYARASTYIVLANPYHTFKKQTCLPLLLYQEGNWGTEGVKADPKIPLISRDNLTTQLIKLKPQAPHLDGPLRGSGSRPRSIVGMTLSYGLRRCFSLCQNDLLTSLVNSCSSSGSHLNRSPLPESPAWLPLSPGSVRSLLILFPLHPNAGSYNTLVLLYCALFLYISVSLNGL